MKNLNIRQKISITLIIAIGIGCIAFIASFYWRLKGFEPFAAETYQTMPNDKAELSAIEGNAEIKFPYSAREIHAYTTGLRDISTMIRFKMDADELPTFIESTLCIEPLQEMSPTAQNQYVGNPSWWQPHLARRLVGCGGVKEYSPTQHIGQQILVDMTNSYYYLVYVNASSY